MKGRLLYFFIGLILVISIILAFFYISPDYTCDLRILIEHRMVGNQRDKDFCYMGLARSSQNPYFCGKISNSITKDACYFHRAIVLGNVSLCDFLTNESHTRVCFVVSSRDISSCKEFERSDGYSCYYWIYDHHYQDTQNISICDSLTQPHRDLCYYSVAAVDHNITTCENIENETEKLICVDRMKILGV